jgi:hypothetical protein
MLREVSGERGAGSKEHEDGRWKIAKNAEKLAY